MPAQLPAYRLPPTAYRRPCAGFTLVEVIAVMTMIAIFAGVIGYAFMRGGNSTVGLQAAQSTVSGLLTLVRSQAAVSGRNAALFVNVNNSNPDRYLRFLVPAVRDEADSEWDPLNAGVLLPSGCYVVPSTAPSGAAIQSGEDWSAVNSTLLGAPASFPLMSTNAESWAAVEFTSRGTIVPTPSQGNIVVATGRPNAPGSSPPFVFMNPNNVRGVAVSAYGLTRLVNESAGF